MDNYEIVKSSALETSKVMSREIFTLVKGKLDEKQDAEPGKGLSTEDYTTADKTKLSGIASGAEVNVIDAVTVNGNAVTITNKTAALTIATGIKGDKESSYRTGNVNMTPANIGAVATSAVGTANGVAELDANGIIIASQLPSYVDDVLEYAAVADFPATGEGGKIYVATSTNLTYRWTGTGYSEISQSIALGETSSTAYRGDRGKAAYDHSQTVGNAHSMVKGDIGLGNVDNTSDADKPVSTAQQAALDLKVDKVTGKGLSTNDFTDADKSKLDSALTQHQDISGKVDKVTGKGLSTNDFTDAYKSKLDSALTQHQDISGKVDKVTGKGLSTNDFTTAEKNKLAGIPANATANTGTITEIKMNGASKGTSGVVDLGTVLTEHQSLAGKQDKLPATGAANRGVYVSAAGTVSQMTHTLDKDVPSDAVFTDTNTTYTLTQDATDGHKFTFAGSDGTSVTITIPDNNTTYTIASLGIGNVKNYDQSKAIKSITRSGTTFTYTCLDGTTGNFTQQDNNTWTAMTGATSSANGAAGYVPAPPKDGYNTKYLRADGTWVVPPNDNTTYTSKAAASGGTEVSLVTTGEKAAWNAKTANVGTVTKISTGVGLTGGDITGNGTIKAKLKTETAHTLDSAAQTNTASRQYAVGVDKSGYLSVNVPWSDTTYAAASDAPLMDGTATVGSSAKYAREDHRHSTDTSRASAADVAAQEKRIAALENENAILRELISGIDAPIYRTASGNPATFDDGYPANLKDVTVTITPTQSGSGDPSPDNVRPISGVSSVSVTRRGKNLWGGAAMVDAFQNANIGAEINGGIIKMYTNERQYNYPFATGFFQDNTQYTFIFDYNTNTPDSSPFINLKIRYSDGAEDRLRKQNNDGTIKVGVSYFVSAAGKTVVALLGDWNQGYTIFDSALCGIFEGAIPADGFAPYQGQSVTVQLVDSNSAPLAVYGGTLDVTTGELTVTHYYLTVTTSTARFEYVPSQSVDGSAYFNIRDLFAHVQNDATRTTDIAMCDVLPSRNETIWTAYEAVPSIRFGMGGWASVRLPLSAAQQTDSETAVAAAKAYLPETWHIVFRLFNPVTYTLTPAQLATLSGYNAVSTDAGTLALTYRADPALTFGDD